MNKENPKLKQDVIVVDYDPNWATLYEAEQNLLLSAAAKFIINIEHIGSTGIPQQKAKPVIDIMAAIKELSVFESLLPIFEKLGYELIETDMQYRYFLRRIDNLSQQQYHLHIVSVESWSTRKERLMRDYLLEHPQDVQNYGNLKVALAQKYPEDSLAYTKAKTDFIQGLMNKVHDQLGLERINVWED